MVLKEIVIKKERYSIKDAEDLVQRCCGFKSEINLLQPNKKANCKSIMGIISMMLKQNDYITVIVEGDDEESALAEISSFLSEE